MMQAEKRCRMMCKVCCLRTPCSYTRYRAARQSGRCSSGLHEPHMLRDVSCSAHVCRCTVLHTICLAEYIAVVYCICYRLAPGSVGWSAANTASGPTAARRCVGHRSCWMTMTSL